MDRFFHQSVYGQCLWLCWENAGEGVRTTFSTFKDVDVYDVEYCACAELRRQVSSQDGSTKAGNFEVITSLGQCGIKYHS